MNKLLIIISIVLLGVIAVFAYMLFIQFPNKNNSSLQPSAPPSSITTKQAQEDLSRFIKYMDPSPYGGKIIQIIVPKPLEFVSASQHPTIKDAKLLDFKSTTSQGNLYARFIGIDSRCFVTKQNNEENLIKLQSSLEKFETGKTYSLLLVNADQTQSSIRWYRQRQLTSDACPDVYNSIKPFINPETDPTALLDAIIEANVSLASKYNNIRTINNIKVVDLSDYLIVHGIQKSSIRGETTPTKGVQ